MRISNQQQNQASQLDARVYSSTNQPQSRKLSHKQVHEILKEKKKLRDGNTIHQRFEEQLKKDNAEAARFSELRQNGKKLGLKRVPAKKMEQAKEKKTGIRIADAEAGDADPQPAQGLFTNGALSRRASILKKSPPPKPEPSPEQPSMTRCKSSLDVFSRNGFLQMKSVQEGDGKPIKLHPSQKKFCRFRYFQSLPKYSDQPIALQLGPTEQEKRLEMKKAKQKWMSKRDFVTYVGGKQNQLGAKEKYGDLYYVQIDMSDLEDRRKRDRDGKEAILFGNFKS